MTRRNPDNCEYCGSHPGGQHTKNCPLERVPWGFANGHSMPHENRRALADLAEAVRLYGQK